jgi:hypothetical protein
MFINSSSKKSFAHSFVPRFNLPWRSRIEKAIASKYKKPK